MKKICLVCSVIAFSAIILGTWLSAFAIAKDRTITFGVCGPLQYKTGENMVIAAKMAVDEINSAGGVSLSGEEYKIKLVKADSNEYQSVTDAVSAITRLATVDKARFIMAGIRSEATMAQQEVMADNRFILLGTQAVHPNLTGLVAQNYDKYKYFFRVQYINVVHFGPLYNAFFNVVKREFEKIGIEKPRVALQMEKAQWADALVELGKKNLPELGFEIVRIGRHSPTAVDLTSELASVRALGAHVVFSGMPGPSGHVLSKQIKELNIPVLEVATSGSVGEKKHWEVTDGGCNYQINLAPMGPVELTPKSMPFWNNLLKEANEYASCGAAVGAYDSVYILKDAIERAGTLNTDAVVAALEKTDYVGAAGRYAFNPRGHKYPHDVIWGPKHIVTPGIQWVNEKLQVFWPDGNPVPGEPGWEGVRFKGTKDFVMPPDVINYWKGKKVK